MCSEAGYDGTFPKPHFKSKRQTNAVVDRSAGARYRFLAAQAGQNSGQVLPDRNVNPPAGFDDGQNRSHLRPGLRTADVDPVLAAQRHHGGYKNLRYLLLKAKRMAVTNTEYVAFQQAALRLALLLKRTCERR